jgi:hypothetical protein
MSDEIYGTHKMDRLFEDIGEYKLDRVAKLLAGIPDGVYRAVGSALKRAAAHGQTVGAKIVSEEYAIGQNELKKHVKGINRVVKDGKNSYEVTFGYRGYVIPLLKFDTTIDRNGVVSARVLRQGAKEVLDHAFKAHMGTHVGIYERLGPDRFPVRELYGPAATQAFYAREETLDKMDEAIRDTYDKRIDHEIYRILNGFGG